MGNLGHFGAAENRKAEGRKCDDDRSAHIVGCDGVSLALLALLALLACCACCMVPTSFEPAEDIIYSLAAVSV